jgi:hypothetical protein
MEDVSATVVISILWEASVIFCGEKKLKHWGRKASQGEAHGLS